MTCDTESAIVLPSAFGTIPCSTTITDDALLISLRSVGFPSGPSEAGVQLCW